ncbi:hypothetical protein [Burkholderia plantarii]|nr:hypothetical protein [Burkholderia plantarii]
MKNSDCMLLVMTIALAPHLTDVWAFILAFSAMSAWLAYVMMDK